VGVDISKNVQPILSQAFPLSLIEIKSYNNPGKEERVKMVSIEEFKKLEFRIGQIKEVQDIPGADKLYLLKVDLGDKTKQLVAGIKLAYAKEELVEKFIVVADNLEPAVLRGVESQGMLLAASDEKGIAIISPDRPVKLGSLVK
jgi:methionyl-tRNA synthetase